MKVTSLVMSQVVMSVATTEDCYYIQSHVNICYTHNRVEQVKNLNSPGSLGQR